MESVFDELKRYVGFGPADELALRVCQPYVAPHADAIASEFLAAMDTHPRAMSAIADREQRQRFLSSLSRWVRECFEGPWDDGYYDHRLEIGRMHVRVNLAQHYMFSGMNVIRSSILRRIQTLPDYAAMADSVNKVLDLELAIMLESYREAFVARAQSDDRRAVAQLQEGLAAAHARYDQVVENVDMLVTTIDGAGAIGLFNRQCEKLTGRMRAELAGHDWRDVFAAPDERDLVGLLLQSATNKTTFYEGTVTLGGRSRTLRWQFSPLPAVSATTVCALGVDITEARELAERTRRVERLAGLGTMAAGLAHEIRNPINAAQLQCLVLERRLDRIDDPKAREARGVTDLVVNELGRVEALVSEFLQYARPRPIVRRRTDLAAIVGGVVTFMSAEADTGGVALSARGVTHVIASIDEDSIKQVLENLIRNAIEACARGGQVRVELTSDENDAIIRVIDDGPGLPANKDRIFEPFFTSKDNGTGLGLSIVDRIVTEHHGWIDAARDHDETVFTVRLPLQPA